MGTTKITNGLWRCVCLTPRMTNIPIRVPLPPPPDYGSIFTTQKTGKAKSAF